MVVDLSFLHNVDTDHNAAGLPGREPDAGQTAPDCPPRRRDAASSLVRPECDPAVRAFVVRDGVHILPQGQ